jgi:hypothetical protein
MSSPKEIDIQKWLEGVVDREELGAIISNRVDIQSQADQILSSEVLRGFNIDHHLRYRSLEAARHIFTLLDNLERVTATQNISLEKNGRMLPDLVLFNPEHLSFVLIEIKREGHTTREAITELLAYEHELRNHVPLSSKASVSFVVVTPEAPTLIEHGIAGLLAWQGHSVMLLKLSDFPKTPCLTVSLPTSWTSLNIPSVPPSAVTTVTWCLYRNNAPWSPTDSELRQCITAAKLATRDAERSGSHGFVIVITDTSLDSLAPVMFRFGFLNPYQLLLSSGLFLSAAIKSDPIFSYLSKIGLEDMKYNTPDIEATTIRASQILETFSDPAFEGFLTLEQNLPEWSRRGVPIYVDHWGVLGDHAQNWTASRTVRTRLQPELAKHGHDWNNPIVGSAFIEDFTGQSLFIQGEFVPSALYKFGVLVMRLRLFADKWHKKGALAPAIEARMTNGVVRMVSAMREIRERCRMSNIDMPSESLCLDLSGGPEVIMRSLESTIKWFTEVFLKISEIHQSFFVLGLNTYAFSDEEIRTMLDEEQRASCAYALSSCIKDSIREFLFDKEARVAWGLEQRELADEIFDLVVQAPFSEAAEKAFLEELDNTPPMEIADVYSGVGFRAADSIAGDIWHKLPAACLAGLDIEYIKQELKKLPPKDGHQPAILISPNATYGIGYAPTMVLSKLDAEKEVWVADSASGILVVKRMTWAELKATKQK